MEIFAAFHLKIRIKTKCLLSLPVFNRIPEVLTNDVRKAIKKERD